MGERRKIKEPLDVVAAQPFPQTRRKQKKGYYTVGLQERKRRGESAFVIQFYLNGKRKSLFLGAKYSRSFAEEICRVVEKVVVALTTGSNVDRRTYAWLESMEVDLRERFESAGLLEPEIRLTLGELFDAYFRAEDSATPRSPSGTKRARR